MQTWVVELGLAVLVGLVVYQVLYVKEDLQSASEQEQEPTIKVPTIQLPGGLEINPWESS